MSNIELKPCPFRVHGERSASMTQNGVFYYNEYFMPCLENECPVFNDGKCSRSEFRDIDLRKHKEQKGSWIPCSVDLPNEGEWVLAKINDGQPESPHRDVVRILKGITEEEREQLRQAGDRRAIVYYPCDEHDNNLVPYSWKTFGPAHYFGQEVIEWMPLP